MSRAVVKTHGWKRATLDGLVPGMTKRCIVTRSLADDGDDVATGAQVVGIQFFRKAALQLLSVDRFL